MTYSSSNPILASDYDGFTGTSAPNVAYASSIAATQRVWALIGVGYGDRGYGQTTTSNAVVSTGNTVYAADWNYLINAMGTLNTHQGSGLTPPVTAVIGQPITAQTVIPSNIATLDTNRLNSALSDMTLSQKISSSYSNWLVYLRQSLTINFLSENDARYYFNSGGQVRWSASNVGGTTADAAAWTVLLANMGIVIMDAYSTTYTGTGGTIDNNIGYYTLTASPQIIFTAHGTGYSGPYSYTISVYRQFYAGDNGANGRVIFCDIQFANYTSTLNDGTTTSYIDQYKATGVLTIADPIWIETSPLAPP